MKKRSFSTCLVLALCFVLGIQGIYGQAYQTVTIPPAIKVDRSGKEPAIPVEQQFRLDTVLVGNEYNIFPAPPCLDGNYYVGFQLYYDLGDLNTTEQWEANLEISLLQGDTPLWTKPLHVEMANQTFIATVFHDQALSCDGDYYVKIEQKDTTGAAPEQHLFLKAMLFREYDAVFNPTEVLNLNYELYEPFVQINLGYVGEAAIAYDIEWVYTSVYDGFTGDSVQDAFLFKEPVRVTTAASYYSHPLFYPEGRVWFRARAIGYNPEYPDHRINGNWAYGPGTAIAVSNQQPALNWQLQKSFAEEGKYKNLISYLDGSLRNRQSITNLSTESMALVGESYYDYEGRKVLEMLPAPVSDNSLNYKNNLNNFVVNNPLVQQNTSPTKKKFHYDNSNVENSTVANTSGAGNYYSSANSFTMVNKDYLPAADGFVYTQTEFSRDNTSRVSNQSGVGELFKTDGNNSTRFYYGEAAPVELIRLFGSNVGEASHYKKNFVVDPNKQVSVTYLDQGGRTIATSLAGEVPNNLESLASYDSLSLDLLTVDISKKNKKENGASKTAHKILNATPGTSYNFEYDLSALGADMDNFGCQSCLFDLGITITNPRGKLLNLSGAIGNQSTDSLKYERRNIDAAHCDSLKAVNDIDFDVLFAEAGDYTVVKTLTPKELSFEEMKIILEQDSVVQQQVQLIRDSYVIDSSQCEICLGCEEGETIIEETIIEIANLDCDNIMQQIINYYEDLNGNGYEVTQTDIEAHGLYCKYTFCTQNVASDVFEKQVARVENWSAAVSKGFDNLIDIDPFFNNDSLSGNGFKNDMALKINNLYIADVPYYLPGDEIADGTNEFVDDILSVTDPLNTDFYIAENGELDPVNGKHLLYIDLMGRKPQMSQAEYNAELDKQRWYLYKGFYLEAKRKTKLMIADVMSCDSLRKELEITDNLPQKPDDISAWGEANGATGPVSEEQLEMILTNMSFNCDVKFGTVDSTAIASHLENYLNASTNNFFKLIFAHDVSVNPDLIAIDDILQGHNCSLDSIAVVDPMACLQDTTFTIVDNILWDPPVTTTRVRHKNLLGEDNPPDALFNNSQSSNIKYSNRDDWFNYKEQVQKDKMEERRRQFEKQIEMEKETYRSEAIQKAEEESSYALDKQQAFDLQSISSTNIILPSRAEYDALIDFYNSTGGPTWAVDSGWADADPDVIEDVSDWHGVDTNWRDGHVISIHLNGNSLSGNLPASFGNLSKLRWLSLAINSLSDTIPSSLGSLVQLTDLELGLNSLSGEIPKELGELENLMYLGLDHNNLSGTIPPELGNLVNLDGLNLYYNNLGGILPSQLSALNNLFSLDISRNNFRGPIPSFSANLEQVYIDFNFFTFSDILPFKNGRNMFDFRYESQGQVDVPETIKVVKGETFSYTTNIDRNLVPSSIYFWIKSDNDSINSSGLVVSEPDAANYTLTIENFSESDAGYYWYSITNEAAERLYLSSNRKKVEIASDITVNLCKEFDYSNPTLANFHFELDWNQVIQRCMANLQEESEILKDMAVNKYLEEEISKYYRKQSSQCLQNVSEDLKYTYANKEYHYTLYYYDQAGNLVQTVPPQGVIPLSTTKLNGFVAGSGPEPQHKLKTKYHYNSFNSLIGQHTPDSDSSHFWYDKKGQLRLSQNAQQHIDNKYSYTTYDRLGRIVTVGELATETMLGSLLALLDSASFPIATDYALNDITRTHYDLPGITLDFEQENLRSRVSWIEVSETPEDPAPVATYYSYDIHGNVKSILQGVPGMEAKRVDYVYDLVSGNVHYVMYQYGEKDQFLHRYKYDADNRIELVYSSTDAFIWNKDAEYFYYPHGPLSRVELGQYNVQGLDYYYTLQGWLKGVNMPHEDDPGGDGSDGFRTGKDEFAFTLGYYQNDFTPIGSQVVTADARDQIWARYGEQNPLQNPTGNDIRGLFNGNISWMITDLPEIGRQQNSPAKSMQAMLYDYDQLNRITAARSLTAYNPATGFSQRTNPIEAYDVDYSYDANGNLLTLQRVDQQGALMDDFTYSYYSNSNKLKQTSPVDEDKTYESGAVTSDNKVYRNIFLRGSAYVPSGSTVELKAFEKIKMSPDFKVHSGANFKAKIWKEEDGVYQYDAIGNLIADLDEGVKIKWTPYGKVREVQKGDSTTIHFKYDGTGNRIEKSVSNGIDTVITRYIRDASGNVMAIYNDTTMTEQPIYGSSRLGMYRGGDSTGMRTLGYKNYELSNHLGNVLAVVTDNIYMNGDSTMAGLVSTNDYYPFGLGMVGRSWNDSTYRYGFNGKEKDQNGELGSQTTYDYGFRIYNPAIGKFLSVDPLTASYPMLTPYQFASDNPIFNIDIDGREGEPGAERMIRQQIATKLAIRDDRDVAKVYHDILKAEGDKTQYAGYAALAPLVGAIAIDYVIANYVYLLYNPALYNELGAGTYGMFSDDEWPVPAFSDNTVKVARRTILLLEDLPKISKTGNLRKRWIKTFGELPAYIEVHHLIPDALKSHSVFRMSGLDINDVYNGIPLPKYSPKLGLDGLHAYHPAYNDFVEKQLDEITQLGPLSEKSLREEIFKLRNDLIQLIEQAGSEGKTINEFFKELN